MATINREKLLSKEKLETAFKMFDKDDNGSISVSELKENFGGIFCLLYSVINKLIFNCRK
jgi:Ca2+-binding EF-hand superfamily protein